VIAEARRDTPDSGPFGVVDAIIEVIEEVQGQVHAGDVAGIGLGLPAQIDFRKQTVEFCTNLPLTGIDVRSLVTSRVKHGVTLDNDGHAAALGESRFGVAKGVRDFIMVTVGTGVGGGIFVNGKQYRGHRGLAGELGHAVVDLEGPECPCGGKGHLEAFVGGPVIARRGREVAESFAGTSLREAAGGDLDSITAQTVVEAARAGNGEAQKILSEVGTVLGRGLVGLVNLLNPRLIVIGGAVGSSSSLIVDRVRETLENEAMAGRRDAQVARSELGTDAGLLGAAALALDEYDTRQGLHR
jgi:glucokinase